MSYIYPYPTTDAQREILDWVRGFADEHIAPVSAEYDREEKTPWPVIKAAAEAGLYSLDFFAETMADPSGTLLAMVVEELCSYDLGITLSLFGTALPLASIMANGTPEQMGIWLPRCFGTTENPEVAAFIASEPDAGSDVGAIRTRAVRVGDEWVINGTKTWGTNGGIADVHVITAVVDPALGSRGQAAFIIPAKSTPGFSQGQKFSKMGIRASHTAEVVLDNVHLPLDNVLGGYEKLEARLTRAREGSSGKSQPSMKTFEATRPLVAAMGVGVARAAYEYSLAYAKERTQFGKPIVFNQAVSFQFADMRTRIDAARLLTHRAAQMAALNLPFDAAEGSQAKLFATETAVAVSDAAVQIMGGAGYTNDYPVERWSRDAKILTIFEGTSNIQRLVIARTISGMRVD
jgi:alkylation response protein AidB-like acyl-CoA dehydrogenase